jgi:hypothetical protein
LERQSNEFCTNISLYLNDFMIMDHEFLSYAMTGVLAILHLWGWQRRRQASLCYEGMELGAVGVQHLHAGTIMR